MFTIKAVTQGRTSDHVRVKLFQAARVHVYNGVECEDPRTGQASSSAPAEPPHLKVHLMDERDVTFETLKVQDATPFEWNVVYVLNEQGRTVQTISPPDVHGVRPIPMSSIG